MTANQINWAKHLEDVYHNRVSEAETQRVNNLNYEANLRAIEANERNAQLNAAVQRENAILNAQTEQYKAQTNYAANVYATNVSASTQRAAQQIEQQKATETQRHNESSEKISIVSTIANTIAGFAKAAISIPLGF